ncbi:MAG: hypothetical protein HRT37_06275 [Alteromonadaceae bacterium]|nr:hypothetical protein [Alteromonadaceae bacterium]
MVKVILTIGLLSLFGCSPKEVYTAKSTLALSHSEGIVTASALSKDGQFNLVADGKSVCLWKNSQTILPLHCLRGNEAAFIEIVDISKNNQFYFISNRVSVRLYSLLNKQKLGEWQVADNIINDIDISANGSIILLGFRSGKASVIDVNKNKITTFDKHRLDINSVSLSDNGQLAFTGSSDKKAMLWQTQSGNNIHVFDHGSRVNHVSISADGTVGFTLDAIEDRTFWNLSSGDVLAELDTYLRFFEFNDSIFSPDKSTLLSGSPRQVLQLWRVSDGALLAQWESEVTRGRSSVLGVAFSDDDKIVTTNSDGLFERWRLPNPVTQH